MKKAVLVLAIVLSTFSVIGQNISGRWTGSTIVDGKEEYITITIKKSGSTYRSSFIFLNEPKKKINSELTQFSDSVLTIYAKNAKLQIVVNLKMDNTFIGLFRKNDELFPLALTKELLEVVVWNQK